jgi:hypothetical protein
MRIPIIPAAALCALLLSANAQAQYHPPAAFLLQAQISSGANIFVRPSGATSGNAEPLLAITPTLRLGALLRPLMLLGEISYSSTARLERYTGLNTVALGFNIAPFIWQSADSRGRLYVLFGVNLGFDVVTTDSRNETTLGGGFAFGLGGLYFLHPSFALGAELGSRTQFYDATPGGGSTLYAGSVLYAGLSGSFATAR